MNQIELCVVIVAEVIDRKIENISLVTALVLLISTSFSVKELSLDLNKCFL